MATAHAPKRQIRSVITPASVAGGQTRPDVPGMRLKIVTDRQSPVTGRLVTRLYRELPARAVIDLW